MSRRKRSTQEQETRSEPSKGITFQLSSAGIIGIGIVLCCLFLWMFLLGIWAGQTILYPPGQQRTVSVHNKQADNSDTVFTDNLAVETLRPSEKKKRIAPSSQSPSNETP
jgi:hypothetical protein